MWSRSGQSGRAPQRYRVAGRGTSAGSIQPATRAGRQSRHRENRRELRRGCAHPADPGRRGSQAAQDRDQRFRWRSTGHQRLTDVVVAMRSISATTTGSVLRRVDEQFLALITADEDLLRMEFEAIVATADWPSPPPDLPARRICGGRRDRGAPGSIAGRDARSPRRSRRPGRFGRVRQRAPPRGSRATERVDEGKVIPDGDSSVDGG